MASLTLVTPEKTQCLHTVTLGVNASIYEFGRVRDTIQSITSTVVFDLTFIKLKSYKPKSCINLLFIKKNYLGAYFFFFVYFLPSI